MHYLNEVERLLDMPAAEKSQVMRELSSHYQEIKDELIASGMSEGQAEIETEKRLGDPKDAALSLNPVHCSASWRSTLLAATPFLVPVFMGILAYTGIHLGPWFSLALAGAFIYGTIREFIRGRRPIWLASWLPLSIRWSMRIPTFAIRLGEKSLHLTRPTTLSLMNIVEIGIPVAIALAVCWKKPQLRYAAVLASAFFGTSVLFFSKINFPSFHFADFLLVQVFTYLLLMVVALAVFSTHRYSNPTIGSLFLFTYFWMSSITTNYVLSGTHVQELKSLHLESLVAALVIVWFARASAWKDKLMILTGALFLEGIFNLRYGPPSIDLMAHHAFTIVTTLVSIAIVVLPPVIIDKMNRPDKPEVVS